MLNVSLFEIVDRLV